MNIICLKSQAGFDLTKLIEKLDLEPNSTLTEPREGRNKGKISLRGMKRTYQRNYNQREIILPAKYKGIRLYAVEGALVAEELILTQKELCLIYTAKSKLLVPKLVERLLGIEQFQLVEPDPLVRLAQESNAFDPREMPVYGKGIEAGLLTHLPWQIYIIHAAWQRYLANPLDRIALRQLRVKVRRLRSCLTFVKPALRQDDAIAWQKRLRAQGEALGRLREVDVALISLEHMQSSITQNRPKGGQLMQVLRSLQKKELAEIEPLASNEKITLELMQLLMWLQGQPVAAAYSNMSWKKFLHCRCGQWSEAIMKWRYKHADFSNVEEDHKLRIKIKRFRYALMCLPEINQDSGLMLRKLKRLQDVLGFIHDDYINGQLVQEYKNRDEKLNYEIATFSGWESAKVAAALEQLPELWQDFCQQLQEWKRR